MKTTKIETQSEMNGTNVIPVHRLGGANNIYFAYPTLDKLSQTLN